MTGEERRDQPAERPSSGERVEESTDRKARDASREGFWGKGHEGAGFHRDERRAHSREDYGRAAYDESGRSADDDAGTPGTGRARPPT